MKPFDEQFSDNVRDVFDAWQEPVDEQAWLEMKSRLKRGKKKSVLLLYPLRFAAAAAILLLAGMSAWLMVNQPQDTIAFRSATEQQESVVLQPQQEVYSIEESRQETSSETQQPVTIESSRKNLQQEATENFISPSVATTTNKSTELIPDHSPVISQSVKDSSYHVAPDPIITDQMAEVKDIISEETPSPVMKPLPDDKAIIDYNLSFIEQKSKASQGSGIEISAGSMKTWSMAEVAGGMGYSAGVTRHWNLGSNFSIGSGGTFVYNSFSLEDPIAASQPQRGVYADYSPERNFDSNSGYLMVRRDKFTDMDFMAIDIPINFRYDISSIGKGKIYVSAGLSSLIYLHENFKSQTEYIAMVPASGTNGETNYGSSISKVNSSGSFGALNRFDLGRFLNLSFGYRLNRKKQSLLIEPYMKYPLGNVTSMQLNIGMAGVTLKYDIARP